VVQFKCACEIGDTRLDGWEYRDDWVLLHAVELTASPDEFLRKIAKTAIQSESPELIKARSAQTDPADLSMLSTSKNIEIVLAVAENPSTPASVLEEFANDKRVSGARGRSDHQCAPTGVLDSLAKDKQKDVRRRTASNPSLPLASVEILAKDKTPEVAKAAKAAKIFGFANCSEHSVFASRACQPFNFQEKRSPTAVAQNPSSTGCGSIAAFQSLMSEAGPVKLMELADDPHCHLNAEKVREPSAGA